MKNYVLIMALLCFSAGGMAQHGEPPVQVPFNKLDLYSVND